MLLGAHNSIAGGIHNAVAEAVSIGGECMQIFCKNQRQFRVKPLEPEAIAQYREAYEASGLGPVMVHDSYIINLGHPDPVKREVAFQAFKVELERCEALGVDHLNFHPGSHTDPLKPMRDDPPVRRACLDRIAEGLDRACDEVPGSVRLVIENAAGQGTNVGTSWEEVGHIADAVADQSRIGVCVDTQHAWAAGHDWARYDAVWDAFDGAVGLHRLVAFHLNDSKQPLGARVDRHDNIPHGHLGTEFWTTLMQDTRFKDLVGYLETPRETLDTWRDELAYLRALRNGSEPQVPARAAATA